MPDPRVVYELLYRSATVSEGFAPLLPCGAGNWPLTTKDNLIFVSIAAYRDPQLVPTVADCIRKAAHPELLRFGICWQRDSGDPPLPPELRDDPRFRVLEVNWQESKGACWARAENMKLWQGEAWSLQVDSHCRFAQSWDSTLQMAWKGTGSEKAVLSTYATPFTPGENEVLSGGPLLIALQAFTPEGIPQLRPAGFPAGRRSGLTMRARFLSAGFLFARGQFVEEVPYDPELYFMGEESSMTVRAFTHGYDLFHPVETVVWHDYIRADARKHWGDHTAESQVQSQVKHVWNDLDEKSKRKVQRLLLGEPVEGFGLGNARTLAEYEAYAGLSFRLRKAQRYTMQVQEPPNPEPASDWPEKIYPWITKIVATRAQLPEGSLEDPAVWCVAILDELGCELCRRDFTPEELGPVRGAEREFALVCEFPSESIPASWTIWPLSRSRGWLQKIGGILRDEDFAILREDDPDESV